MTDWTNHFSSLLEGSTQSVVGVFSTQRDVLFSNHGLQEIVGADIHKAIDFLVNPTFDQLLEIQPGENGILFSGIATIGNRLDITISLICRIYRNEDQVLFFGEHDVEEINNLNNTVLDLNKEVNHLQRQVMQKNRSLEKTLKELRNTQDMLIHSEKMNALGQLVAGVAHEINNPIAFVSSNMHYLDTSFGDVIKAYGALEGLCRNSDIKDDSLVEVRDEHNIDFIFEDTEDLINGSKDGLDRVTKIVSDLRQFSHLDEAETQEVDLEKNLVSTISLAGPQLKKNNVTCRLEMDSMPPIQCHPSELNQVFLNIIINASQAMESGGEIVISGTRIEEAQLQLTFKDSGCGMSEEVKKKVFDPFYTTKPVGTGTGLGMSIAYKIITDNHNGTIDVQSEVGIGTTFTITLPLNKV